jgi:hypothetical protein
MKPLCALFLLLCGLLQMTSGCHHATEPPTSTVDTTSHNYTWQVELLGNGAGSGVFYDVAILNDTLAYAVGELFMKDSLGQDDPHRYNAAVWDGHSWTVKRLSVTYHGYTSAWPLNGIFAFSATDIWLAGSVPIHGDGTSWTLYHLFDMGVLSQTDGSIWKIWGSGPTDLYFVGDRGTAVHYDGLNWAKLQTGTTVPIMDLWGAVDTRTGVEEVLAVASHTIFLPSAKRLLSISGTNVTAVSDSGLPIALTSAYFASPTSEHYVGGDGLFTKAPLSSAGSWTDIHHGVTQYYSLGIRGQAANDLMVVGAFGEVVHYNGATWKSFLSMTNWPSGNLYAVAMRGNLAIAVGENEGRAVVLVGRR